jgi:hypothetical protein
MANRLWLSSFNKFVSAAAAVSASSEQSSHPVTHLRDPQRQKTFRSKVGYTVTEDNRYIDFNRGGVKVATIALGNYATQALYSEAVRAALAAADGALTWAIDWNVAAADKFRIRDAGGAPLNFNLLWQSGVNAYRSAGVDLGFDVSADDTGAATYTADRVSYQSRLFIRLNDLASLGSSSAFAYLQHNFPAAMLGQTSLTLQGNATDAWSAPTLNTVYTLVSGDPFYKYDAFGSHLWYRLVINNVCDASGFTEVGYVFLGSYFEPAYCIAADLGAQSEPFTSIKDGISGSRFANVQPERDRWSIGWKTLDPTERVIPDQFFLLQPVGVPFFFDFDPATAAQLVYVTREARSWQFVPFQYRDYATQLVESI